MSQRHTLKKAELKDAFIALEMHYNPSDPTKKELQKASNDAGQGNELKKSLQTLEKTNTIKTIEEIVEDSKHVIEVSLNRVKFDDLKD